MDSERDLIEKFGDVHARCNFDQFQAAGLEPEDGALRDVKNILMISARLLGVERHVIDAIDKLFVSALECEAKTDKLCALCNVDKSARADDAATETTDVYVAVAIDLAGAHE